MKILTTLLIALTVAACATDRYTVPNWEFAEPDVQEVTDATTLPELCPIEVIDGRGTWSNACWQRFERYEIIAERNTEVAAANAAALRATEGQLKAAAEAGRAQTELSQIRQRLYEDEQRAHTMDLWFYRVLFVLGLTVAAL